MVQHGKTQVDKQRLVVDLVVLVVVNLMVVQYNHQQVIISLPQMPLAIRKQVDVDTQVDEENQHVIMEVAVVLEVLVKQHLTVQQVMGDLVCNFLQHSGILHKVLELQDQQIHLHIIQDGLT